ncbi:F5/8 type C domain-containing protein [Rubritalea squalenifaciens DSM 18772]|uniref:F5/8 type C domain-containing protein n=1 Tax=Rubritalea squalenifaciens DSM 18772 TaxID=1123071 RepID=A0A1M6J219_9BACT|nr:discoidin domain-containing protein [Rubritalea squalenifaciens]SHJ40692.1 F5/8 type C domain-containing protein [Rubritalea squalenifaciens DSM 18772]
MRTLLIYLLGITSLFAAPTRSNSFPEALSTAKSTKTPVAVLLYASSWHLASKRFHDQLWQAEPFTKELRSSVILTQIDVPQLLDKEEAKKFSASNKGWNQKAIKSYPAIQLYSPDGFLLKTYQGRELRVLTSPLALAAHIDKVVAESMTRDSLLAQIKKARETKNSEKEAALLAKRAGLTINQEAKMVEQLLNADPKDQSGWQARLSFKGWDFVRHISDLISKEETDKAMREVDSMLKSDAYTLEQRVLILGAKGRILVAQNKLEEAWSYFNKAYETAPDSAEAIAMLDYGRHQAGIPLRLAFPDGSPFNDNYYGNNLTKDNATYTTSSSEGNTSDHDTLFSGRYAKQGFAFHTKKEARPHIVIDLKHKASINAIHIVNRHRRLHERAASLAVWISDDSTNWSKVWSADGAKAEWNIILNKEGSKAPTGKFLKIGLDSDQPEHLHLQAVDVLGEFLKSTNIP